MSDKKLDGLENTLSRKNVRGKSKSGSNEYNGAGCLPDGVLRDIFNECGIGRQAVGRVVDDAFRKGFNISNDRLSDIFSELKGSNKFRLAHLWGRLFGGSLIVMVINDGADSMTKPINKFKVKSVEALRVYDRSEISIISRNNNPLNKNYGEPEVYRVTSVTGSYDVHYSRCIRFGGIDTDNVTKNQNDTWDNSALRPVYDSLMSHLSVLGSGEQIMDEFVIGVLKMKNLMQLSATEQGEKTIIKRLELTDESKSNENTVVIDGTEEDYTKHISSISGFKEVIEAWMSEVAGSCVPVMPQTVLFGRSPAGQNATGDSDIRLWYDGVATYQKNEVLPKLTEFFNIFSEDYSIDFNPVYEETQSEKATAFKDYMAGASAAVGAGIYTPEEIATSRNDINLIYDRDTTVE